MLMTSLEIVKALSEDGDVVSSVAMEDGLVVLFHVRSLIWSIRAMLFCSAIAAVSPAFASLTVLP